MRRALIFTALLCLTSVGLLCAAQPAGELPEWAAKTIPRAEDYERERADADYAEKVRPNLPEEPLAEPAEPRRLLVFYNVRNYRHTSEVLLRKALPEIGRKTGAYTAVVTDKVAVFTPERLAEFDAICLNQVNNVNQLGVPDEDGCRAAVEFVRKGGGLAANHASIVAFARVPEWPELIGGRFGNHPFGGKTVTLRNEVPGSPFTTAFGDEPFEYLDEIFIIRDPYSRKRQRVLLSVDWEASPEARAVQARFRQEGKKGFREDNDYAVSWIKTYGKGRVFYTSLGHEHATIADPRYLTHLLAGIQYALGDLPAPGPEAK